MNSQIHLSDILFTQFQEIQDINNAQVVYINSSASSELLANEGFADSVKETAVKIWEFIKKVLASIKNVLSSIFNKIRAFISTIIAKLRKLLKSGKNEAAENAAKEAVKASDAAETAVKDPSTLKTKERFVARCKPFVDLYNQIKTVLESSEDILDSVNSVTFDKDKFSKAVDSINSAMIEISATSGKERMAHLNSINSAGITDPSNAKSFIGKKFHAVASAREAAEATLGQLEEFEKNLKASEASIQNNFKQFTSEMEYKGSNDDAEMKKRKQIVVSVQNRIREFFTACSNFVMEESRFVTAIIAKSKGREATVLSLASAVAQKEIANYDDAVSILRKKISDLHGSVSRYTAKLAEYK